MMIRSSVPAFVVAILLGATARIAAAVQCGGESVIESPDSRPKPIGTNPIPTYPKLLLDAGIGDSIVVEFVVDAGGAIEATSYCVKRESAYPSLSHEEIRRWAFEPARGDGSPVRAPYRLTIVFAPLDTIRGPMRGGRVLDEVVQPSLDAMAPRLVVGPSRSTFGMSLERPVVTLEPNVERTLVERVLALADLDEVAPVCVRIGAGSARRLSPVKEDVDANARALWWRKVTTHSCCDCSQ